MRPEKEGGDRLRKRIWKGSFTVEAALLMTILIPVSFSLIYMGMYLHDRAAIQNAALEAATRTAINKELAKMDGENGSLTGERLQKSISKKEDVVKVEVHGNFQVPGLLMRFLNGGNLSLDCSVKKPIICAKKEIQKWRNLEKVLKGGKT